MSAHTCGICGGVRDCDGCDDVNSPCPECANRAQPRTGDSPLMAAAREAARAIEAMCAAQDNVRRETMVYALHTIADASRGQCWHAIDAMWNLMRHGMRREEIHAMRSAVNCGIVAPAWALRVIAVAAEVEGYAAGAAEIEGRYKPHG